MSLNEKKLINERDAVRREAEAQRAGRSRALLRLRIERQQWRVQADSAAQMMSERDAARAEAEVLRRERDAAQVEIERLRAALARAEALYHHKPN